MDKNQNILDLFEENQNFAKLAARRFTFYKMVEHLAKCETGFIIETGTAWDKDNWDGQGQSTLIWDWVCKQLGHKCISIDLNPGASETAKTQTSNVDFMVCDSVAALADMVEDRISSCRLLYLDSFDWSPEANLDSAFHHMAELATVWAKLSPGTMIVVDDRHGDMKGKHFMVELFMEKLGIKPVFKEYQIGWIKP